MGQLAISQLERKPGITGRDIKAAKGVNECIENPSEFLTKFRILVENKNTQLDAAKSFAKKEQTVKIKRIEKEFKENAVKLTEKSLLPEDQLPKYGIVDRIKRDLSVIALRGSLLVVFGLVVWDIFETAQSFTKSIAHDLKDAMLNWKIISGAIIAFVGTWFAFSLHEARVNRFIKSLERLSKAE